MNKIKHFSLLFFCLTLSTLGYTSIEKLAVESIFYNSTSQSAINAVNNDIRLISVDEKTVFVIISTNGIVDQSRFSNSEEINTHFLKTEGVIECSYSWNNNMMKLVLDKTSAKQILINTFGFESKSISQLF
jgi:hypothetical protein